MIILPELLPALAGRPHRRRGQVDHPFAQPRLAHGAVLVAAVPAVVDAVAQPLERQAAAVVGAGVPARRAVLDVVAGGLVRLVGAVGVAVAVKVPRDALAAEALELAAAALLPRAEVGGLVLRGRL